MLRCFEMLYFETSRTLIVAGRLILFLRNPYTIVTWDSVIKLTGPLRQTYKPLISSHYLLVFSLSTFLQEQTKTYTLLFIKTLNKLLIIIIFWMR